MISHKTLARFALDGESATPLYRQIYSRITGAVLDGSLVPGARLPSARSLAAQLSIARGTVEAAYQLLAGEGYIVTRGAAGTRVDPALDAKLLRSIRSGAAADVPDPRNAAVTSTDRPPLFKMGLPALDAFPHKVWSRLVARHARSSGPAGLVNQPPAGNEVLRTQIARYLAVARGVSCTPTQIFITSGYQGALGLITRSLLRPGDAVLLENPTYPNGSVALRSAGARLIGVPVDGEGFDVGHVEKKSTAARLVFVTPTHQFPLSVTMSLPRRMALLKWAAVANAWIIEDDYDSEFRYRGKPLPALKSLDRHDRVLYTGTFSKVLSPGLRVGYLVLPPTLIERFTEVATWLQPPPSTLVQASIATFLEQGHLAIHIRRMRQLYAERRTALVEALYEHVGDSLRTELQPGGMHLLAFLRRGRNDTALVARMRAQGIAPAPLSECGVEAPYASGLLIGFANVDVRQASAAARRLAAALHSR